MIFGSDNSQTQEQVVVGGRADIDEGLRAHMVRVYNVMGMGLVVTALTALGVTLIPALQQVIFGTPLVWVAMFAPLVFLWFGLGHNAMINKSAATLRTRFFLFAALFGISMSTIFIAYTAESIVRVFFITASMFLATSLYGYTTKRDLSGFGSFLFMGLIGLIIASVVNIFMQSSMLHWIVSVAGVFIFTGMAAWDTQRIKESYALSHGQENNNKLAVMGALSLYLNFVLLFQHLMMILGQRE
ncbi:MAG: hypothetical protein CMP22_08330 [Rickettsiales bacterium]|nr:hypothetical protein [Rickettsiales bacterium]